MSERKKFLSPVRNQMEIKTETIDDIIPPKHDVRLIWLFVEQTDLSGVENQYKTTCGEAGRPAIDPRVLLAIWIWGIIQGIVSARALEEACLLRSDFRWICGGLSVNYHTISDFRSQNPELMKELFVLGLAILSKEGLVDLEKLYVDGTKMRANASTKSFHREKTLDDELQKAEEVLARLESMSEEEKEQLSSRKLKAKIRQSNDKIERIKKSIQTLGPRREARRIAGLKTEETRASTTDPDANRMKHNDGGYRMSYNIQVASTESACPVIAGTLVGGNSTDSQYLSPMINKVKELNNEESPDKVIADNGYMSVGNVQQMEEEGIQLVAPDKNGDAKDTGEFSTRKFILADDEKSVTCPLGKVLPRTCQKKDEGRTYLIYKGSDCAACPMKDKCSPKSKTGRTVKVLVKAQREVMERHREMMETEECKALVKKRKQICELVNAFIKCIFGVNRILVRGIKKVQGMVDLIALAYNVRIWIKEKKRVHAPSAEPRLTSQNV